jgi:hypothetical protein
MMSSIKLFLLILQLMLGLVGLVILITVDWRIALGVFICIFSNNIGLLIYVDNLSGGLIFRYLISRGKGNG